jgi:hypothetical protein
VSVHVEIEEIRTVEQTVRAYLYFDGKVIRCEDGRNAVSALLHFLTGYTIGGTEPITFTMRPSVFVNDSGVVVATTTT